MEDNDKITIHPIVIRDDGPMVKLIDGAYVKAGFPSPALDFMQDSVDLNKWLIKHPESTFIISVEGDSMVNAFIADPAYLMIDRSLQPRNNDIVLGVLNGEFTVKFYCRSGDVITLVPANNKYKPTTIIDGMEFQVWGVVTKIIIDPRQIKNVRIN